MHRNHEVKQVGFVITCKLNSADNLDAVIKYPIYLAMHASFILIYPLSLSHVLIISFAPAPLHTVIVLFLIHPNFAGHIGCLLPPYFLPLPSFGLPAPHFRGWLIFAHPPPAIWYTPMVFYDEICFENIKNIWLHCRYSRSLSNLSLSSDKHPFCFFLWNIKQPKNALSIRALLGNIFRP